MRLSEFLIEPVWNATSKRYENEKLDKETIEEIVFSGIEDDFLPATYAIVFGTSRKIEMDARVQKAVQLYKEKRVKKLVFTGGKNGISNAKNNQTPEEIIKENRTISYIIEDEFSEAERMGKYALELGVKKEDILLDCLSNNSNETLQNITSFIQIQEGENLILITSEYHVKRCLASALKYVSLPLTYSLVAAPTGYFESENYEKTKIGKEIINFEAYHLIRLARENKIFDLNQKEGRTRK